VQIVLGFLAVAAAVLAVMFFLSSGPRDAEDGHSLADDAAASAAGPEVPVELPAPIEKKVEVPRPADAGIDPASDDQIADDAAAAGMTSRTPSTPAE
jgi:hypothetical protein